MATISSLARELNPTGVGEHIYIVIQILSQLVIIPKFIQFCKEREREREKKKGSNSFSRASQIINSELIFFLWLDKFYECCGASQLFYWYENMQCLKRKGGVVKKDIDNLLSHLGCGNWVSASFPFYKWAKVRKNL